ncbi:MAG: dodecin domain-containing protein [Acidobacteriota bacterium]|nr:dodecin domain-containing protein [Acidobacteriota bacterium]
MNIESSSGGQMGTYWGQSYESYDAAIAAAVEAARQDLAGKTLEWMEVLEFRGGFSDGRLQYQTAVRIGYA